MNLRRRTGVSVAEPQRHEKRGESAHLLKLLLVAQRDSNPCLVTVAFSPHFSMVRRQITLRNLRGLKHAGQTVTVTQASPHFLPSRSALRASRTSLRQSTDRSRMWSRASERCLRASAIASAVYLSRLSRMSLSTSSISSSHSAKAGLGVVTVVASARKLALSRGAAAFFKRMLYS